MEAWQLMQKQSLPLEAKVVIARQRIRAWYEHWGGEVYVSFSGGKDSTVLLHLVRQMYPHVDAVFVDTRLEFPEIRRFVRGFDNVTWLKPKKRFKYIIENRGYPVVSKEQAGYIEEYRQATCPEKKLRKLTGDSKGRFRISKKWQFLIDAPFKISDQCCYAFKKGPFRKYEINTAKKPILGLMASEGNSRKAHFLKYHCNAYSMSRPRSNPLYIWDDDDIWEYIRLYDVPYSKIYDMGYKRTGCIYCLFGVHLETEPNRFQMLKQTHPKLWEYGMYQLGLARVLDFMGVEYGARGQKTLFSLL